MVSIDNNNGHISISREVFSNLAGDAATNCFGVKGMAGKNKEGFFQLLKKESMSKGVVVKYGENNDLIIELHIAVDQGVNISAICHEIQDEVSYKVTKATGIPVTRVDIFVDTMMLG